MNNPILSQFTTDKWAMEPTALQAFFLRLGELRENSVLPGIAVQQTTSLQVVGDTAIIPISGVLLKTVPGWAKIWGVNATGYDDIRQQLEQALAKRDVKRIHLQVASPGGQVAGVMETGEMIRAARQEKTVTATIEDLGASGAYWLASQAETLDANANAEVGSIGVYTAYIDYSAMAEGLGLKVIVIRSGEHKGMGIPGAPISDAQIAAVQEVIDAMAENFVQAVAAGRNLDPAGVRALATGRLWIATAARELGLIDAVIDSNSNNETSSQAETNASSAPQGDTLMTDTQTAASTETKTNVDQAAVTAQAQQAERQRMQDLKAEFPNDPAFAMDQFAAGADVTIAKAAYCDVLRARQQQADDKAEQKTTGAEPLEHNEAAGSTASGDFMAEARQLSRDQKISMTDAMRQLSREKPELYAGFQAGQNKRKLTIKGGKARRV